MLPRLSRAADHGVLWLVTGGAMAWAGDRPARRAALRGAASLAVASAFVNTLGKRSVRRDRPLLDAVPVIRQLHRQPFTTSFPSGHSASAVAFATGAALESRQWGALLAPVAASVAFSRVYTGVHYPSDVVAGGLLGAGAAFAVRGLVPTRAQLAPPARPRADAPRLPGGRGLTVVVNSEAGMNGPFLTNRADQLRDALPDTELVFRGHGDHEGKSLTELLDGAAATARRTGGALGVLGGDGTASEAADAAARHGVPLAVFPGGTHNHFALDLGIEEVADTCRAVAAGEAVAVDLGRFTGADGRTRHFLNTFSLGSYPDLVHVRERWAPRIGGWPAGVLAALEVLRASATLEFEVAGSRRRLWLLFAGNCTYRGVGVMPLRRFDLADGMLDVRVVHGGRLPRARLVAAALCGPVRRSPLQAGTRLRRLRLSGIPEGISLAYDGEVAPAPAELILDKVNEAVTAYRPLVH